MKQTIKRILITGAALAFIGMPTMVAAEEANTSSPSPSSTVKPTDRTAKAREELQAKLEAQKQARQEKVEAVKTEAKERLEDAKKRACENHQTTINRLMDVMDKRRENAFDRITKISDAVQAFYVKKQLTVANYDDLVAAIAAAKTAAQTATASQLAIPALNCSGDHPRADVADFKEKRAGSIDAMRAYRDAVKELVKAVKTAAEAAKDAA